MKSSWSCDLPPGEPLTWGVPIEARECADWFNAKSIVMGGANVVQTRIPDAPFAFEARSNGAKLCVVSPDFNSSAVHADPFLQIQPGTDALQALGVAKLLIDNDGINRPSVIEQTAMPLLVRRDTGKFLREADLKPGGDAAIFSLGDRKSNAPVPAPGCEGLRKQAGDRPTSLKRDGLDVALEGSFKVKLHDGKEVEVGTVFARLREELKKYPLEKVAAETGLPAAEIAAMARDLGTRFPAMIIHGAGTNPWFPNDAINRALIVWRANSLNQAKGNELIFDSLWKQLDLIVDVNFRMDTTALSSDVVLPAASYYEKTDRNSTDCPSFIPPFGKALEPLFESKTDWDIFAALAKKTSELAKKRGLAPYEDKGLEWTRDLTKLYDDWSDNGALAGDEAACNFILAHSAETKRMTYHGLHAAPQRFVAPDPEIWTSDIEPGIAYTPFKHHVEQKKPWRTLVGRQQFYIDHDWNRDIKVEIEKYKGVPPTQA